DLIDGGLDFRAHIPVPAHWRAEHRDRPGQRQARRLALCTESGQRQSRRQRVQFLVGAALVVSQPADLTTEPFRLPDETPTSIDPPILMQTLVPASAW